jgi:hypothetical protein
VNCVPPLGGEIAVRVLFPSSHFIPPTMKVDGSILNVSLVREYSPEYAVVEPEPKMVETP